MLELVLSNRAEALLDALAERVAARQAGPGFWTPVPIVVPNPLVRRFVEEGLAARLGAAVNLDLVYLERALGRSLPDGMALWTPESLAGRLRVAFDAADLAPEPAAYLRGPDRERKALQLAQRLGARFLDYALHRPGWVQAWRRGASAGEAEGDRWQGRLFRAVDAELAAAGLVCPADLAGLASTLRWPEGALLVSLNTLAPTYLELLRALGARQDLAFFVLNPCADYWADHATRKAFLEGGEPPEGHPALGLWGRPGRDFVARLYDLTEGQDEARYEEPGRGTLLRALQSDLLAMQPPQAFPGPDRSLKALAAPDPRREAEVVAGEIWRLLQDPPSGAPLTFADLAIVIPAAASAAYLEHLRAAFEATGGLPLSFETATAGPKALLAEACGLMLDLLGSEASRAAVLRLLRHPASRARHPELDLEAAVALCERTGILRGLDDGDFEGTYLAGLDRLHWGQGLARAALAAFLPDGASPAGRDLPAAPVDRDAALALTELVADLRRWREGPPRRAPQAWAEAFAALAARHLGDGSEPWVRARTALQERLQGLAAWSPAGLPAPELAFAEARELLRSRLAGLEEGPEGGGGIRVSTAMPMRAVPFRAVFVMGLTGGLFPAVDRGDPLDLRQRPGRGLASDLGRAEQDRYLFLELLLSARDALRLSHPALDAVTGDPLPRSSVLEELLEILQAMGVDPDAITEIHPLRRFEPATFAPGSPLRSLAPGSLEEVRALVQGTGPATPPLPPASTEAAELRITLSQLHAWLVEPAEGFAQIRLGLRREDEDPAAKESELLAPERLEASSLEREVLLAALGREAPEAALDQAWRALELRGQAPLGPAATAAKAASLARVQAWARAFGAGTWSVHRFGGHPATEIERCHEPLRLEVEVGGRRRTVSLEGATRFVAEDRLGDITRSDRLPKERALERHLRLRVDQLALAAAGLPAPERLLVADGAGKVHARDLPPPDPAAARAQLEAWLAAILAEGVPHRLPAAYAAQARPLDPGLWIAAQDRRREPWTVLPGSRLRTLPAPDRGAALGDLAFRLGPLLSAADGADGADDADGGEDA